MRLWADQGECRKVAPQLFFQEPVAKEAREACERCPVWKECQTWAIHNEMWGYWGRTTAQERKRLRSKLNISIGFASPIPPTGYKIRHGTPAGYKAHLRMGQSPVPKEQGGCGCWEAWSALNARNKLKTKKRKDEMRERIRKSD